MYDITSKSADDFINHEEILDTIKYADENKNNIKLIDSILEKAKLRKGLLWKSNRNVCSTLSVELLC